MLWVLLEYAFVHDVNVAVFSCMLSHQKLCKILFDYVSPRRQKQPVWPDLCKYITKIWEIFDKSLAIFEGFLVFGKILSILW